MVVAALLIVMRRWAGLMAAEADAKRRCPGACVMAVRRYQMAFLCSRVCCRIRPRRHRSPALQARRNIIFVPMWSLFGGVIAGLVWRLALDEPRLDPLLALIVAPSMCLVAGLEG